MSGGIRASGSAVGSVGAGASAIPPGPAPEPAPIPTPRHDPAPSREAPVYEPPPAEPAPVSPPQPEPAPAREPTPVSPPGGDTDLPKAATPQPDDLIVSPEAACGLVSEHGGEIVIMDDGRVVFMNASAHLVEIAAALDPDNADIQKRLLAIERARKAAPGESAAGPATDRGG